MKAPMSIRKEITKVLLDPNEKNPNFDIELLPTDPVKRKMVWSHAGSTSSMTSKKVTDCGKMKVVGPLGLAKD